MATTPRHAPRFAIVNMLRYARCGGRCVHSVPLLRRLQGSDRHHQDSKPDQDRGQRSCPCRKYSSRLSLVALRRGHSAPTRPSALSQNAEPPPRMLALRMPPPFCLVFRVSPSWMLVLRVPPPYHHGCLPSECHHHALPLYASDIKMTVEIKCPCTLAHSWRSSLTLCSVGLKQVEPFSWCKDTQRTLEGRWWFTDETG